MNKRTCMKCVFVERHSEDQPCKDCVDYDYWNKSSDHPYFVEAREEQESEVYHVMEVEKIVLLVEDLIRLANTLLDLLPDDLTSEEDMYGQRL